MVEKQLLTLMVNNNSGVLRRVAGILSRKGHNIYSLHSNPSDDPKVSEMKIVMECGEIEAAAMIKQLLRLYDIIRASNEKLEV